MWTDIFIKEDFTGLLVSINNADTQQKPEVLTQVLKELRLIIESKGSSGFE